MADKRIIELTNERLTLGDGDYTIVDSNEGTYKYKLKRIADSIPAPDTTLSIAGRAADAAKTGQEISDVKRDLNDKANIDGTYDGMTVGSSRQLLSESYLLDEEPYLFRASGGDGSDRVEECIVGGSVGWNQLTKEPNTTNYRKSSNASVVSFDNGVATFNAGSSYGGMRTTYEIDVISEHKYFVSVGLKVTTAFTADKFEINTDTGKLRDSKFRPTNTSAFETFAMITSASGDDNSYLYFWDTRASGFDEVYVKNIMFIDLTQMFGSTIADYIYSLEQATAGAGVAWFKKYFPDDYYPYSAPTLRHVEGVSQKEVVGFNQCDEEWESGAFNSNTGAEIDNSIWSRSKNYIPVLANTSYYYYIEDVSSTYTYYVFYYDANKNYISNSGTASDNRVRITPSNCAYIRIQYKRTIETVEGYKVCINLSDPTKNGVYEPYRKNIYPLDSSLTLRGIPKLTDGKMWFDGDKYNADGTVQRRYGIMDLGTLTWNKSNAGNMYAYISGMASNPNYIQCCVIAKYTYDLTNSAIDKTYWNNISGSIWIRDLDYTDAATFTTAMSGVYLVYELATPTTEEATPYTALQTLDPNGTEEFVTTGIVPVGHYSKYLENLRSKIEGLPRDFSTLIAPTEKAYKATRNYTVGSLLIVDNILYKVTSAIANGGTITPNTNVTATTLAAVIAAL